MACEIMQKLQDEELNKEVEYTIDLDYEQEQNLTYEEERKILTPEYLEWEADHQKRFHDHISKCTDKACMECYKYYQKKGLIA